MARGPHGAGYASRSGEGLRSKEVSHILDVDFAVQMYQHFERLALPWAGRSLFRHWPVANTAGNALKNNEAVIGYAWRKPLTRLVLGGPLPPTILVARCRPQPNVRVPLRGFSSLLRQALMNEKCWEAT